MKWWPFVLGGGALALVAIGTSGGDSGPAFDPDAVTSAGRERLRELLQQLVDADLVPQDFATFAEGVAHRESRWNNKAANTSAREADAARRLYEGALERGWFPDNPHRHDVNAWTFGSGGWFGFLPSTGLTAGGVRGPFADAHPSSIFVPEYSLVMAADLAARTAAGKAFRSIPESEQNWLAVNRGWAASSLVPDWREDKQRSRDAHRRLVKHLDAAGMPPEAGERFVRRRPSFPNWNPWRALEVLGVSEVA